MINLYQIGAITMDCPMGLNPQEADEEFGADFAVKPVVGAQQPREFVGPADNRLTLSGTIFPFRFAAAGGSSGQSEIALLKSYAGSGQPQPIVRGDGLNMGFYLIEKAQLKHRDLSRIGIGRRQSFAISLVQSPTGPSAQSLTNLLTGIISLLGSTGAASGDSSAADTAGGAQ